MDELVVHRHNRYTSLMASIVVTLVGATCALGGVLVILDFNLESFSAVFAFILSGAILTVGIRGIRGYGHPESVILTPQGLRIARGNNDVLVPAPALLEFAVKPMTSPYRLLRVKGLRSLNVRIDPAAAATLPDYAARLKDTERPDELRLIVIAKSSMPPKTAPQDVREFVRRHGIGEWDDRPQPV